MKTSLILLVLFAISFSVFSQENAKINFEPVKEKRTYLDENSVPISEARINDIVKKLDNLAQFIGKSNDEKTVPNEVFSVAPNFPEKYSNENFYDEKLVLWVYKYPQEYMSLFQYYKTNQ